MVVRVEDTVTYSKITTCGCPFDHFPSSSPSFSIGCQRAAEATRGKAGFREHSAAVVSGALAAVRLAGAPVVHEQPWPNATVHLASVGLDRQRPKPESSRSRFVLLSRQRRSYMSPS